MCGIKGAIHSEGGKERMRKLKLVIIGVLVVMTALFVVFIGCDNESAPDPTQEDLEKLGAAMGIAFDFDFESPPAGITLSGNPMSEEGGTITFDNYVSGGVTVNGSLTMSAEQTGDYTATITITGTITFSGAGAPVETLGFNMTIAVDFTDYYNPEFTISGTFSIDGEDFNASGLVEMFEYYLYDLL
jgi:hypothetical protein